MDNSIDIYRYGYVCEWLFKYKNNATNINICISKSYYRIYKLGIFCIKEIMG